MNKMTSGLALAAALIATPSLAADLGRMPVKSPVYTPAPPPLLWNGFYIGAQIGYAWGRNHSEESITGTGVLTGLNPGFDTNGVVGGLHLGYNYQMSNLVFGLEGDAEASGVDGNATVALPNTSTSFRSRWQGSIRGRVGMAFGPTLLYATGGVAFADLRDRLTGPGGVETFDRTRAGWTVGAGAEWAISPAWSTRLEYRYTDFGNFTDVSAVAAPGFSYQHNPTFHTVRLGVSYHF